MHDRCIRTVTGELGRPRLLDLFCGAGGAAVGYSRAGFDVTGVDIVPQPRYPFTFIQGDALEYVRVHGHEYDAIHASPPCQAYCTMSSMGKAGRKPKNHPELIVPCRERLQDTGAVYAIENVVGAPLLNPAQVCGSSFGLHVRRHRLFESNVLLFSSACLHPRVPPPLAVYGDHPQGASERIRRASSLAEASKAMGISWMIWRELTQAIPPAYTEFIGRQLIQALEYEAAS